MVIKNDKTNVAYILIGSLFLLGLFWVLIPDAREAMAVYFGVAVISLVVYRSKEFSDTLFGISTKNIFKCIFFAGLFGLIFYLATKFVPSLSWGYPALPQSVSSQTKAFIILIIAPWIETFFVQGAFFGWIRKVTRNDLASLIIQALFFASLHLTAYISSFYSYPSFASTLTPFLANISSFISAFVFAFIAGFFLLRKTIRNLAFVGVFHFILNLIIYTSLTVTFLMITGFIA